jgi:hypothetical protein
VARFGGNSRALPEERQLRDETGPASVVERGKCVPPIRSQRERVHARHRAEIEIAVEVRKEGAATRRLPFQPVAKLCGVNADQQQIGLSGEMLRGGLGDLRGAGKMNEAITAIDLAATKDAGTFGFPPQCRRANFVKDRHCTPRQEFMN